MFETIKKVAFTGMGLAALTREKAEEIAKELISKGKLTEQEGEKFVQELVVRAEESKVALKEQTEKIVSSALSKMSLAKAADLQQLKEDVEKLRTEIALLKEQIPPS